MSRNICARLDLWTVLTLVALASFVAPNFAKAAVPAPDHFVPQRVQASYTGWAYVASGTPISAWQWSSTGWKSANLPVAASVWAAPFASGWQWAHRAGVWYAVR